MENNVSVGNALFKLLGRKEDWSALPDESKAVYENAANGLFEKLIYSGPELLPLLLTAVKVNIQAEQKKSRYLSLAFTAAEDCENWLSRFLNEKRIDAAAAATEAAKAEPAKE